VPASFYLNIVATGFLTGLVYGLMALGLSVIFGVVRVVNFAHGELTVAAMFAAFFLSAATGLDPIVVLPVVAAGLFVIGYQLQRWIINPFIGRPEHEQFVLLVAVSMIVLNALLLAFGPDARHANLGYAYDSFEVGPLLLDKVRVYAAVVAVLLACLLFLFFRFTLAGKAIRAAADNLIGAEVIGLDVKRLYQVTFGIGAACVGAAGSLLILVLDAVPALAPQFTMLAFIIVIIGGLGSMSGALIGGVLIGVSEAVSGFLFSSSMKSMVSFALLILVLLLRPQGIMGRRA
jgi:branched-chain amino acid transport system permease protein